MCLYIHHHLLILNSGSTLDKQEEVEVTSDPEHQSEKLCHDKSTHRTLKLNAIEQSQYQLTVEVVKSTAGETSNARQIDTPHYK